ncbi:MAG: hypothetical protein B7Z37_09360 [Verrucomicrobia bacterium 12-59-8]|nr:MAG: hypothetical protein B7Z37_09360 [Verrucomicrobia bacterium 12-59-8]
MAAEQAGAFRWRVRLEPVLLVRSLLARSQQRREQTVQEPLPGQGFLARHRPDVFQPVRAWLALGQPLGFERSKDPSGKGMRRESGA